MSRVTVGLVRLLAVTVFSSVVGSGIEFIQAHVYAWNEASGRVALAHMAGVLGALFGVPVGLAVYYVMLRAEATFDEMLLVVAGTLAAGIAFALVMGAASAPGWLSSLLTPIAAAIIAAGVRGARITRHEQSF